MYAQSRFGQLGRAETQTRGITKKKRTGTPTPLLSTNILIGKGEGGQPKFSFGCREQIVLVTWRDER